ncbi:MAG TPA: TonB family protein [Thermoanaerobaculia bacterium]|jgi:protein TonB|nr:TonB family protein [Thermoanaerobaculia bacterium]
MFEHSLIDLEAKTQPRRRRWISLPLAIGLHLVGLTAFAFASYWNVGPVTEPSLNVAFIDVLLPPPPPAGGGGHPKPPVPEQPQPKTAPTQAPTVRQPTDVPDMPATPTPPVADIPSGPVTSEGPVSTTDGPGIGPGDGPGDGPGIGPGNGPGVEPGGDSTGPVYLTAEMSRPRPLQPIQPRYTEPARRAGVQGTVMVEAIIDEKGRATNVRVVRSLPMGLDRSAVEAIQQVTFQPAMRGGRPVKVYFNLTVNFTIQR